MIARVLKISLINLLFVFSFICFAKPSLPMPKPQEVHRTGMKLDQAVEMMFVSETYYTRFFEKMKPGRNLIDKEVELIEELIADESVPASEKELIYVRYGLGDSRITNVLIKAKKAGIKVSILTDFNRALDVKLPKEQPYSYEFEKFGWLKDADGKPIRMARAIQEFLDAGFSYNGESAGIYSQPVYTNDVDNVDPIMHEKAIYLRAGKKSKVWKTTGNAGGSPRFDRAFLYADQEIAENYRHHALAWMDGFKKKMKMTDVVEPAPRTKFIYDDGHIEVAYTAGRYNPNDRIADLLSKILRNELKGVRGVAAEFVDTNGKVHPLLLDLLEKDVPEDQAFTFLGLFDDRFGSLYGWGLSPALAGYTVTREFGPPVRVLKSKYLPRAKIYFYQRPAIDPETQKRRVEESEEGPPESRHLCHDKTFIVVVEVEGKKFVYAYTGTLNLSNHFENLEAQDEIYGPESSVVMQALIESIEEVIKAHSPAWAVPADAAIFRNAIGGITGHTDIELDLGDAQEIWVAALQDRYEIILNELQRIRKERTSHLASRPSDSEFEARIQRFRNFVKWYSKLGLKILSPHYQARRLVNLATILANPGLHSSKVEGLVRGILWRPIEDMPEDQLARLVQEGIQALAVPGNENRALDPAAQTVIAQDPEQMHYTFDWLNNIAGMKSPMMSSETIPGRTKEVPLLENQTGNLFRDDLSWMIENLAPSYWQGPSFEALLKALVSPESAKRTHILLPPKVSAQEFEEGLHLVSDWLQKTKGITIHIPPRENFLNHQLVQSDSAVLANSTLLELDKLQKRGVTARYGFSHSDPKTFNRVQLGLELFLSQNPDVFNHIKIVMFYTGHATETLKPGVYVYDRGKSVPRIVPYNEPLALVVLLSKK